MERRDFLKSLSAAGLLSMMDPAYLSAKDRLQSGQTPTDPVPKRQYGRAQGHAFGHWLRRDRCQGRDA